MSSGAASRLLLLQRHLDHPEGGGMEPVGSPLTTHVLDTASGLPAQGLCLHLSRLQDLGQQWMELRTRCECRDSTATVGVSCSLTAPWACRNQRSPTVYVTSGYTDPDGRCPGLLTPGQMKAGTYKLLFDTQDYWKRRGQESFYPYVEVVFTITNETQKCHVPLLLSPWSYTTYRGS